MDLHAVFTKHALEIGEMLEKKNALYGDENLLEYGLLGVLIRLRDKLARLENILFSDVEDSETLEDILKDIAGYPINALRLYRDGRLTKFGRLEKYMGVEADEEAGSGV